MAGKHWVQYHTPDRMDCGIDECGTDESDEEGPEITQFGHPETPLPRWRKTCPWSMTASRLGALSKREYAGGRGQYQK